MTSSKTASGVVGLMVLACAGSASAQLIHALRFDTDGTLDTTGFGAYGEAIIGVSGSNYTYAADAVVQSDGKIVMAGTAFVNGGYRFMVARRNAAGTPDTTFSQDGFAFVNETFRGGAHGVAPRLASRFEPVPTLMGLASSGSWRVSVTPLIRPPILLFSHAWRSSFHLR